MQVSKSWLVAVDSEIKSLAEGTQLPRNLAKRFLSVRSLDLQCWNGDMPLEDPAMVEELVEALLNLPSLRGLLNVFSLEFMAILTRRTSLEDLQKVSGPTTAIISNWHALSIDNVYRSV